MRNTIRISYERGTMKRYLPPIITVLIVVGIVTTVSLLLRRKAHAAAAEAAFVLDPAKRNHAEEVCKQRLNYDENIRKCTRKSGKKEGLCKEDLEKKLQECIHLELIRNAETIDEALAIEEAYRGRPLTPEERLAVTAETMFDDYQLR